MVMGSKGTRYLTFKVDNHMNNKGECTIPFFYKKRAEYNDNYNKQPDSTVKLNVI